MARPLKWKAGKIHHPMQFVTDLKVGDTVMVIVGGNTKKKKELKGKVGKILRFVPKKRRVVVEGLNFVKRHKRPANATESAGVIVKEGSVSISNVMFYSEKLKRPVRLKHQVLPDGRKVRCYKNPETKQLEVID